MHDSMSGGKNSPLAEPQLSGPTQFRPASTWGLAGLGKGWPFTAPQLLTPTTMALLRESTPQMQ